MVTVSLTERPICGWFFSSLSKYCQPYSLRISTTQVPT
jgi:hypothetical protein